MATPEITASADATFVGGESSIALDITIDGHDNVFIAEQLRGVSDILEFTASSGYTSISTIDIGALELVTGIAVDAGDDLYVADALSGTVTEFVGPNYSVARTVDANLGLPEGLAVDGIGNVFVVGTDVQEIAGPATRKQHREPRDSTNCCRGLHRHFRGWRQCRDPGRGHCSQRSRPDDDAGRRRCLDRVGFSSR